MPKIPPYFYPDELFLLWIDEEKMINSAQIISHIFWDDWIDEQERKVLKKPTGKHSLIWVFNAHPIYSWLTNPIVQDTVFLVSLAECLSDLSSAKNIKSYIERLKSREVWAAIFELFIAKNFQDNGFVVEGLQLQNPLGNPVEVVVSKAGTKFWIECKSTESKGMVDDYYVQIIQNIMKQHDYLSEKGQSTRWIWFYVKSKRPIESQEECNSIKSDLRNAYEKALILRRSDSMVIVEGPKESLIGWELQIYPLSPENQDKVIGSMYKNWMQHSVGMVSVQKDKSNSSMPSKHEFERRTSDSIVGAGADGITHSKKLMTWEKFITEVQKKISQQKSLLEAWEEVIIVFDSIAAPPSQVAMDSINEIESYGNLTILLAEKRENPRVSYNFIILKQSRNFTSF